jgi:hypothetical protein
MGAECDHRPVGDHDAAQALELLRALRHELDEMTTQLAWVERQDVTGRNGRACALRLEAAALRRDIREAQFLIDRLQRRYLNGDERTQQRPAGRLPPTMVDRQTQPVRNHHQRPTQTGTRMRGAGSSRQSN